MRIRSLRGCECWLLLAASVTVAFIYLYTSQSERDKFESEHYAVASLIVKSLLFNMRSSFLGRWPPALPYCTWSNIHHGYRLYTQNLFLVSDGIVEAVINFAPLL
jgi:hypothetical protein